MLVTALLLAVSLAGACAPRDGGAPIRPGRLGPAGWAGGRSRGYQLAGRPLTPVLAQFDLDQLLAGEDESCGW